MTKEIATIVLAIAGALLSLPAQSAEKIQFFYGPFEPTIYVEDLETFAQTGEVVDRFSPVARRLSAEQQESLRGFLNASYGLGLVATAQFAYSPTGQRLLQGAGEIVQTENFLNGMKALRAGLIFAAANGEQGYTPLEVIRYFPLETIQINAQLARQVVAANKRVFGDLDEVVAEIERLAGAQSGEILALEPALESNIRPSTDPSNSGQYTWKVETVSFQNPERPAASIADIYYPDGFEAASDLPVVVISHGLASNRQNFSYLAKHLASHGYAVVAVEHIQSDDVEIRRFLSGLGGEPDPYSYLLRPRDITAVLDSLAAYQGATPALKRLNLESVGLLGQSQGGYTALAASGATINRQSLMESCSKRLSEHLAINLSLLIQCRILELPEETSLAVADPRIAAVIAINPYTSGIFGEAGLQQVQIPVMLISGTRDYFVPALPEQIEPFSWLTTEHKHLVLIDPGTHFTAIEENEQNSGGAFLVPSGLIGPEPRQAFPQIQALSLSFFNHHLQDQPEAKLFLSQAYLNEFPAEPFQFTLIDEL